MTERKRRNIDRLETLVLEAVDGIAWPTLTNVKTYVGQGKRLWPWTAAGVMVALHRLESRRVIECRRTTDHLHGYVWVYVRVAEPQQ